MKKSLYHLILILSMGSLTAFGQISSPLPRDENGKITFLEVVMVDTESKELLYQNARSYLQSLIKKSKLKKRGFLVEQTGEELSAAMAFTVYSEFPVKSPHGVIRYDLTISVKQGRYRYIATNFIFHYLKRNRYGKFVEVSGKSKHLEEPFFKGNQKVWDNHKNVTQTKIANLAQTLNDKILIPEDDPKKEIVKINADW